MMASGMAKLLFLLLGIAMSVVAMSSATAATSRRPGRVDLWYNDIQQAAGLEDVTLLQNQLDQEHALSHGGSINWKDPGPSSRQRLRQVVVTYATETEEDLIGSGTNIASETQNNGDGTSRATGGDTGEDQSEEENTRVADLTSMGVYDCPDAPGSKGFLRWKDLINAIEDDSAGGLNTVFLLCPAVMVARQPLNIKTSNIEIGCVTVGGCTIQNATVAVWDGVQNVVLAGLEFSNQAGELTIGFDTNVNLIACTFRGASFSGSVGQRAAVVTAGRTLFLGCHFEENLGKGAVFIRGGKPFFESCRFASNKAVDDNSGASAIFVRTVNERTSKVSIRNTCFDENQGQYVVLVEKKANSNVVLNDNNAITNSMGGAVCQGIGLFYGGKLSSCADFDLIGTTCTVLSSSVASVVGTPAPVTSINGGAPSPPAPAPTIETPSSPTQGTGPATEADSVGTTEGNSRGRSSIPQDTAGDPPERDIFADRKNAQPTETETADTLDDALARYKNSDGILAVESTSCNMPNLLGPWLLTIAVSVVAICRL